MTEISLRLDEIREALKRARRVRGLSTRQLAEECGVKPTTLNRFELGLGNPDMDNLAKIAEWLNFPLDGLIVRESEDIKPVVYYPNQVTPEIVQAHLDRDPTLTPEARQALGELFRVAYSQFARDSPGDRRGKRKSKNTKP